jgi:hypothetical protein
MVKSKTPKYKVIKQILTEASKLTCNLIRRAANFSSRRSSVKPLRMEASSNDSCCGCIREPHGRASTRTALVVVAVLLSMFAYTQLQDQLAFQSTVEQSVTDSNTTWRKDGGHRASDDIHDVNCSFLITVLRESYQVKQQLDQYWNTSNYPNFKAMMNIPEESWNLQKAKFVKLVLEAGSNLAGSHLRSGSASSRLDFVVGFSGSSVTAGHGTFKL